MRVQIKRLDKKAKLPILPTYATSGSIGLDLYARAPVILETGMRGVAWTGIALALPPHVGALILPRSGNALADGIHVHPGLIDSDFRGEIGAVMFNLGQRLFVVNPGDKIAQLVILPFPRVEWEETDELPESERGAGGFGSTGK